MSEEFGNTVERWVRETEERQLAVVRTGAQDLAVEANTPQDKGGRMPVDFGFLRNSLQAARNGPPAGPGQRIGGAPLRQWDSGAIALTLQRLQIGDRLIIGWTANYAPFMEARYMFMRSAAQRWPQIIDSAARRVHSEVTGGDQ